MLLAHAAAALKQQNPGFYQQLLAAFHEGLDPEHKLLLSAPADQVLRQQGRAAMGVEILEVLHTCEKYVRDQQHAQTPVEQRVMQPVRLP